MTVYINIGRRVPRSWFRRTATKVGGLLSFQENLWLMIRNSMNLAKRKANASGQLSFLVSTDRENENMNYELEWIKIVIRGTKEQEKEEHDEAQRMYEPFGKIFKDNMPVDEEMKKHFKTRLLANDKVQEAYKAGYGVLNNNSVANKMLEMGILTHIELVDDYATREVIIPNE